VGHNSELWLQPTSCTQLSSQTFKFILNSVRPLTDVDLGREGFQLRLPIVWLLVLLTQLFIVKPFLKTYRPQTKAFRLTNPANMASPIQPSADKQRASEDEAQVQIDSQAAFLLSWYEAMLSYEGDPEAFLLAWINYHRSQSHRPLNTADDPASHILIEKPAMIEN
jgi:hypothetical protein